jgi:hypothetical protein
MVTSALLGFGILFPALSLITLVAARWTSWRTGRNVSAVLIPFIGPILLTSAVLLEDWSYWLIPVFWAGDLGTIAFLIALPQLFSEWWQTSRFTCCLTLHGNQGIESAILTLHTGGHYFVEKAWRRSPDVPGIIGLGEFGTYVKAGDNYELTAHFGLRRTLTCVGDTTNPSAFAVTELTELKENQKDYSLAGWTLQI